MEELVERLKARILPFFEQSTFTALKHTYDTFDEQLDDLVAAYVMRRYRTIEGRL